MLIHPGAGVSAESGIPTFRGAQGLWRSFDPMELGEVVGRQRTGRGSADFPSGMQMRHVPSSSCSFAGEQAKLPRMSVCECPRVAAECTD